MCHRSSAAFASLFAIVSLLTFCPEARAQTTSGSLEGRVVDAESGAPVSLVNVVVTAVDQQGSYGTMSLADGRFWLPVVPVGTYLVRLSHVSYAELEVTGVKVRLGRTTVLADSKLSSRSIEMPVMVVEGEQLIDPRSTEVSSNFTQDELDELPTQRDYRSVIQYLPQTNISYYGDGTNIAGGTGSENAYIIDGVNVTDPYMSDSGTGLPQNFIGAIEVKAGGYQPEFGRSSGGIVNVITRSGTNEFKAEVFGYYTSNNFASDSQRGRIGLEQTGFARYDLGLSLGGPIVKDKLWYFAAYDPTVQEENLIIPGFGEYTDSKTIQQFAAKVTWRPSDKWLWNLSAFGDPATQDRVGSNWFPGASPTALTNPDPFLGDWTTGGYTLALEGSWMARENLVVEGGVSRLDRRLKTLPATEIGANEAFFEDVTTGVWEGGYANPGNNESTRNAARLKATWRTGPHELKGGLEYEDNSVHTRWAWQTATGADGYVWRDGDGTYGTSLFNRDYETANRIPTAYLQDSWVMGQRFTLNVGVRWDGLNWIDENGDTYQQIDDQLQPRIGFVFQPGEVGSQKIFGSAGRFYQQFSTFPTAFGAGAFTHWWIVNVPTDPRTNPGAAALGDSIWIGADGPAAEVEGLRGQHYDEVVLGYERVFGRQLKLGLKGVHRELREAIEDTVDPATGSYLNTNPGGVNGGHLPDPVRTYSALEFTADYESRRYRVSGSYVLSRSYGNHPGVFNTDVGVANPNSGPAFDYSNQYINAEGLLPNDRTHLLKLFGSYRWDSGFSAGGFFAWQSGTPLSEQAYLPEGRFYPYFLTERGTAGRMPSLWDLNLRFAYDFSRFTSPDSRLKPRLLLDIFHLFGQEERVTQDQVQYLSVDVDNDFMPSNPNPTYGEATAYQPPMVVRLGVELGF